ncbi:sugar phosphate nucleotidyltransferase [Streptomyces albireticuli]|uniref:GDP-mannose pyrophosphorylase n=1 Tax=Streptomyces albireticuli TaxID=1940 RepID=A0A2A2DDP6_9ACTN|nr:NDP-sugar synthase [Streptomyces albireticuli]MCD9145841.1 NDP-sugar synthase [Streptomyces albireticuli]MCD9165971.1 NDP-sugar synthase [Streptomyces albireticuli]MCD9196157.1 NDP-sugar synthase [Streptomyces albireticuli]PAU49460.1 GDP-mannose pyrophosphorylase [Streptomyces albireticuli]
MKEAVLLVGGKGTRLQPLTLTTPKPMVPAAGVPFLAHQLARARAAGVRHVVLATSYLAEVFEPYFGDGSAHGLRLTYVTEDVPLGTGGAVRAAAGALASGPADPVLVLNGDILSGLDLGGLLHRHERAGADVTLYLTRAEDPRAFGLVPTGPGGRVLAFTEKPRRPEEFVTDQVNAGVYVFRREVMDTIPAGRPVSLERETFPGLLASGALLHGVVDTSYWLDLGRPASFVRASADLVRGVVRSPAVPGEPGEFLLLPGARVEAGARLGGGTVVGAGAHVAAGAEIEGSVVLDGARVGEGARIRASMVGRQARVGPRTLLDGAVIGDHAGVGADNELRDGARVWCGTTIPDAAIRFSAV